MNAEPIRFAGVNARLLPRHLSFGPRGRREYCFHPSLALLHVQQENERLARQLWDIERSGLLVPKSNIKRSAAPRTPEAKKLRQKAKDHARYVARKRLSQQCN
jgi:hypothetical protein